VYRPKKPAVREFEAEIDSEAIEREVLETLGPDVEPQLTGLYEETIRDFKLGEILEGRILDVISNDVFVDVGYKSEGIVQLQEFDSPEEAIPGARIEVLLEAVEDDSGLVVLSKRKADRIRGWENVISVNDEGDVVTGRVTRKIKGGLLVDIGVPVFLPASQVNIRRTGDISEYIGQEVECKIIKIDCARRNIVVSRRKLLEERRESIKKELLSQLVVGELRTGVVKSITDFGAFVDLGGIDGLLHITDMSWGRVSHPSEVVALDQKIEVKVLSFDAEKEKISLGLKQKTESPWVHVLEKYPVGSRITGQVVNVMSYGAFVKLEEGVEGLVHISEMSWTRRINHPSDVVAIGDTVEVVVLGINTEKQEISLGMKQIEINPWTLVEQKYPPGTVITGRVRNMTNYGAFIEIEEGIDGLLHISDISWTKKIKHPSEMFKKGERVETMVLAVDQQKKRVALGMKQLVQDPWEALIPGKYEPGNIVVGKATKFTNFGVFIELDDGLEGLLHISELADHKVEVPEDVVKPGETLRLMVIRVDPHERKIGLSLRRMADVEEQKDTDKPQLPVPEGEQPAAAVTGDGLTYGLEFPDSAVPASEVEASQEAQQEVPAEEHPAAEEAPPEEETAADEAPTDQAAQVAHDAPAEQTAQTEEAPPHQDAAPEERIGVQEVAPADESEAPAEEPASGHEENPKTEQVDGEPATGEPEAPEVTDEQPQG